MVSGYINDAHDEFQYLPKTNVELMVSRNEMNPQALLCAYPILPHDPNVCLQIDAEHKKAKHQK